MPKRMIIAAGLVLLAGAGFGAWLLAERPEPSLAAPELAPRPGAPLVTFVRIQTEMNHAAAHRPPLPVPAGSAPDPLEHVALALRDLLGGDLDRATRQLDEIDAEIERRLPSPAQITAEPPLALREEWLVSYFELLPDTEPGPTVKAETRLIERLAITLHRIDALLLVDLLPTLAGYDLVSRHTEPDGSAFDGLALRLPCRMAADHRAGIEAAARLLGPLAGPLTDCPVPPGREADFDLLERLARDPTRLVAEGGPGPADPPAELVTPLITAADRGDEAAIRAALAAGGDPQRADGRGRTALWYLLGNQSVPAAERAALARRLF